MNAGAWFVKDVYNARQNGLRLRLPASSGFSDNLNWIFFLPKTLNFNTCVSWNQVYNVWEVKYNKVLKEKNNEGGEGEKVSTSNFF